MGRTIWKLDKLSIWEGIYLSLLTIWDFAITKGATHHFWESHEEVLVRLLKEKKTTFECVLKSRSERRSRITEGTFRV